MKSLLSLLALAGLFLVIGLIAALWTYSDIKRKSKVAAKDSEDDNAT